MSAPTVNWNLTQLSTIKRTYSALNGAVTLRIELYNRISVDKDINTHLTPNVVTLLRVNGEEIRRHLPFAGQIDWQECRAWAESQLDLTDNLEIAL